MSYLGRSAKLSLKAQEKVSFLATAGQTVKTGLSYTPSFIEVYVNGVLLTDNSDYTATNGNSITFTVALLLNDEVTVISLKTFTVADHYTKSDADTLLAAKATNTAVALKAPIASPSFTGGIGVTGAVNSTGEMRITNPSATSQLYLYGAAGQKANIILNEYGVRAWNIGSGTFTSGQFSISDGSTEHMRINQAGIVTKPNQPMVSMSRNEGALSLSSNTNVFATTNITTWVLQGITHNTSNGRFTLPVAGKYRVSLYSIKNGSAPAYFDLQKNGGHYGFRIYDNTTSGGWQAYSGTGVYSFAANDYLTLICVTGGTNNMHGGTHMNFAIELIG